MPTYDVTYQMIIRNRERELLRSPVQVVTVISSNERQARSYADIELTTIIDMRGASSLAFSSVVVVSR